MKKEIAMRVWQRVLDYLMIVIVMQALALAAWIFTPHAHAQDILSGAECIVPPAVGLTLGTSGIYVQDLQVILDADPDTQVAATGPGSATDPTTYFGPLTQDAVDRFQEKYAADILFPLHLYAPTGYYGVRTQSKMYSIYCEQ